MSSICLSRVCDSIFNHNIAKQTMIFNLSTYFLLNMIIMKRNENKSVICLAILKKYSLLLHLFVCLGLLAFLTLPIKSLTSFFMHESCIYVGIVYQYSKSRHCFDVNYFFFRDKCFFSNLEVIPHLIIEPFH